MLGLLLIYFLGKKFYELAEEYKKHQWGYAIGGVAMYYIGTFIGGIFLFLIMDFFSPGSAETMNDNLFGLLAVPFGLLAYGLLYLYLKRSLEKKVLMENPDILDDEML